MRIKKSKLIRLIKEELKKIHESAYHFATAQAASSLAFAAANAVVNRKTTGPKGPLASLSKDDLDMLDEDISDAVKKIVEKYLSAKPSAGKHARSEYERYTTKGQWVIKSLGEDVYYMKMRLGGHPKYGSKYDQPVWGTRDQAKVYDNELEATVRKDMIEKLGMQATVEDIGGAEEGSEWYSGEHETRADRKYADRPED
jgi:osmotically-inducible protein OsmY